MKRAVLIPVWMAAAVSAGRAQLITLQGSGAASYMDLNTNFSWLSANKINFHSGSGAPTINCSQGMDAYTNTATGDVYWCTAANTWAQIPNVADSFVNPSWIASLAWSKLTGVPSFYYQTLQANTAAQAQRANLNFGAEFALADSSANNSTTVDIAPGGVASSMIASVNSNSGTCGDAAHICQITTNASGQVTNQTSLAPSGAGNVTGTSGSGAPSGSCSRGAAIYTNTSTGDVYWCSAANTWTQIPEVTDSFVNPSWIASLAWSKLTGVPSFVAGPGSSTSGYLPQWNNAGGTLLSAGLPVSITPAANTVVEAGAGGTISASWIPTLNQNTTGNAATATALAATPSQCSSGQFATGIAASGNANCGTPSGSGNVTGTSGSGAPTGNCSPPTGIYVDTTNLDLWFCDATNTWKKVISTTNTGPWQETGNTGSTPSSAPSGEVTEFLSSTSNVAQSIDANGNIGGMVKMGAAGAGNNGQCATAGQFVQGYGAGATPNCAAAATGPGSSTANDLASFSGIGGEALQDSGIPQANVVTAASAAAAANQVCVAGGANKTCSYIDWPEPFEMPAANCNGSTPGSAWNLPSSSAATAACLTQSNTNQGVLTFAQSTSAQPEVIHIPRDWDSGGNNFITIDFDQGNYTTASSTVTMSAAVGCSSTPISNPSFQTAQNFGSGTTTTTAYTVFSETVTLNSTSLTNCAAGGQMFLKISRVSSDTSGVTPDVFGITVTLARRPVLQAE